MTIGPLFFVPPALFLEQSRYAPWPNLFNFMDILMIMRGRTLSNLKQWIYFLQQLVTISCLIFLEAFAVASEAVLLIEILIPTLKMTRTSFYISTLAKDCGDVKMLVKERRTVNFTHIQNFPSFLGHLKSRTSIKRFPILLSSIASSGKIVTISSFLMSQATGRLFPAQKTVLSTLSYVQLSRTKEIL